MTITLQINSWDQYVTAYDETGKPVATLQRRRVYKKGPAWKAYNTDGSFLFASHMDDARYLARLIERHLQAIRETDAQAENRLASSSYFVPRINR